MGEFFAEYGLFLAKVLTVLAALLVLIAAGSLAAARRKKRAEGEIEVRSLNEHFDEMRDALEAEVLDEFQLKQMAKEAKKQAKAEAKTRKQKAKKGELSEAAARKRIYVVDFNGDLHASEAEAMREEISAILAFAREQDEVCVRLESPGGLVHSYGFAASQLERIRRKGIPLVVCVDQVAASGGYMMACIANRLIAAPFAMIGSVGVVAQLPNFHRLLKRNDIDFEVLTAGEYKRTLTLFGENTEKGRQKFKEDLEETHQLFKEFVSEYRPQLDIDQVATGEVWFGRRALEHKLIDEISTSDDYLVEACKDADLFKVTYQYRATLQDKIQNLGVSTAEKGLMRLWSKLMQSRFWTS